MLNSLPLLLALTLTAAGPQEKTGTILSEPETGATITLPEGWNFASGDEGLVAQSADKRAFILLGSSEKKFDELRADVAALVLTRLDDIVLARSVVAGVDERGALEALILADGTGVSKKDGERVDFSALVLKVGDAGALVLGAWKDPAHAELVGRVLDTLHVKQSTGEAGLMMTDVTTGASITFPAGWEVVASKRGILGASKERGALIVVLRWQEDFEKALIKTREGVAAHVFKDIEIGDFGVVEASYDKSLGRVVAAYGTAADRIDGKPVEFTALRIQNVTEDQGSAILAAWKDEKSGKQVEKVLASVKLAKK